MIVSDMDGTLLNSQLEITPYTTSVLRKIQDKGIILTIASGRSHYMMSNYYRQLNMQGYMVGVNGLELYSFNNDKLEKYESISYQKIAELCQIIFQLGYIPILMYDDETLVISDNNEGAASLLYDRLIEDYSSILPNIRIKLLNNISKRSINKMCVIIDLDKIVNVMNCMKTLVSDDIHLMRVDTDWIEIMPNHINKALRIKEVMEKENITSDEIMVFGDSQNDIEMLKLTQNSYAMMNARDDVKECAKYIAASHNDDGVAREIEKLLK